MAIDGELGHLVVLEVYACLDNLSTDVAGSMVGWEAEIHTCLDEVIGFPESRLWWEVKE